jgi:uncharacterized protein YegP (UPF0339 family)
MATATKQPRSARAGDQRAVEGAPSEFLVFQSNSGEYRWEVVSGSGATLAQSVPFVSYLEAEEAAVRVREGAGATRLELRKPADRPRPLSVTRRGRDVKGS